MPQLITADYGEARQFIEEQWTVTGDGCLHVEVALDHDDEDRALDDARFHILNALPPHIQFEEAPGFAPCSDFKRFPNKMASVFHDCRH